MYINLKDIFINFNEKYFYALSIFYISLFFPFIAVVNYFFNADSNVISIIYRITALVLGVFIVTREVLVRKIYAPLYFWILIGFWSIYLIRYFADLFIFKLYLVPENGLFYYFTQGFLVTFFNFIAVYFAAQKIDFNQFVSVLRNGILFVNILVFTLILIKSGLDFQNLLQSRFEIESTENGNKYLNPITISSYAVFGILLLQNFNQNSYLKFLILAILIFNIFFSASLSPTLGLIFCFLIFGVYRFYSNVTSLIYPIIRILSLLILSILFIDIENALILQRLLEGGEGQSSIERKLFLANAFNQIKENIFWGTHYYTITDSSSPHNIFIDVVLSTGIFGLFLFLIPIFVFLKTVLLNFMLSPIFQIAFISFFIVQFSGYVFGASDFFAFLGIVFALKNNESSYA